MGSLADVTLGDIGRALGRYRPVLITVLIILVVLAVLPGPRGAALRPLASVPPPAAAASGDPAAVDPGAGETATGPVEALPGPAPAFDSSSSFGSSSSSSGFSSDSSDFSDDDFSSPSSDFESAPAPTFDFSSEDGTGSSSSSPTLRPLSITSAGWASTGGGTPIGSTGVPAGALPVAKRIGQVDKYSYVRLEGEQKVLSLKVADGGRTTTGAVGVSICAITEGDWTEGENVPSDAAPAYDEATCVPGDPGDGTAWSFNLVTFASPTDPRGFALVPTGESIDYQINFARA